MELNKISEVTKSEPFFMLTEKSEGLWQASVILMLASLIVLRALEEFFNIEFPRLFWEVNDWLFFGGVILFMIAIFPAMSNEKK
ncbi:hypothetical protein ACFWGC_29950 [Cytobacillus pseudoceanisediminis]|uniref:hypothetical protein n=1 Tax=Cytobacillus pseudoceanisediminis TaxID=3051614 RepID=UPI00364CDB0C